MFIKELFDRPRDTEDLPDIEDTQKGEKTQVSQFSDSGGDEYKIYIKDTVNYIDPVKYTALKDTNEQEIQVDGADIRFILNKNYYGKRTSKHGLEVMSTVINKLRQYIIKNKPNLISFTISGNSHHSGMGKRRHETLLKALVRKIQKEFKYEEMEQINTLGHETSDAHYYLFHKKPRWRFGLRELLSKILQK